MFSRNCWCHPKSPKEHHKPTHENSKKPAKFTNTKIDQWLQVVHPMTLLSITSKKIEILRPQKIQKPLIGSRPHEPMRGCWELRVMHQAKTSLISAFCNQCSSKSFLKTKKSLFPKTDWNVFWKLKRGFPLKRRRNADSLLSTASRPNSRGHCHLVAPLGGGRLPAREVEDRFFWGVAEARGQIAPLLPPSGGVTGWQWPLDLLGPHWGGGFSVTP